MLVLHGGGGPALGYPFADRLADRFELIEPVLRALPARRSRTTSMVSRTSSISISI